MFRDLGIEVVKAAVDSAGGRISDKFYVTMHTAAGGKVTDKQKVSCKLHAGARSSQATFHILIARVPLPSRDHDFKVLKCFLCKLVMPSPCHLCNMPRVSQTHVCPCPQP